MEFGIAIWPILSFHLLEYYLEEILNHCSCVLCFQFVKQVNLQRIWVTSEEENDERLPPSGSDNSLPSGGEFTCKGDHRTLSKTLRNSLPSTLVAASWCCAAGSAPVLWPYPVNQLPAGGSPKWHLLPERCPAALPLLSGLLLMNWALFSNWIDRQHLAPPASAGTAGIKQGLGTMNSPALGTGGSHCNAEQQEVLNQHLLWKNTARNHPRDSSALALLALNTTSSAK